MGPLRVVYNVTSNISPYHDDSSSSTSDAAMANGSVTAYPEDGVANTFPPWSSPWWRYVPYTLQRPLKAVIVWCKGPVPPRPWSIKPFYPAIQTAPIRFMDRFFPKRIHRILLLIAFYFCWLLAFAAMVHHSYDSEVIDGYGKPGLIDCTSVYWEYKNECGLNGDNCRPFTDSHYAFRCPASCITTDVLEPHAVGAQEINYRPLVIGGPTNGSKFIGDAIYRADSFICSAAIHAGFITNRHGGCGVVELIGQHVDYPSVRQNGINSIAFNSSFPMSYRFLERTQLESCKDLRWAILGVSVTFSVLLSLFTTSPAVFFMSIFTGLFFHIALVSGPPESAGLYVLTSIALHGFLPACFIGWVGYRYCASRTLGGLQAQFEKTVFWLGPCWVGALCNYTFDLIPLSRLYSHDINQQPGAITALTVILIVLVCIVVGQVWAFRVAGLMPRYLGVYAIILFLILMLLAIPHLTLRIHHGILAIALYPGTSLQTRPCLVYQGILTGLFLNGVGRWGMASILETTEALLGNAPLGSALPHIKEPVIQGNNITFEWGYIPPEYDAVSVLVNDVERFRTYGNHTNTFTWQRFLPNYPEYFRFGYMAGTTTEDYTRAGIWHPDNSWQKMKPGPS